VIGVAPYFDDPAFHLIADATKVAVEFVFDIFIYEVLPIFGAEDDVEVVLD